MTFYQDFLSCHVAFIIVTIYQVMFQFHIHTGYFYENVLIFCLQHHIISLTQWDSVGLFTNDKQTSEIASRNSWKQYHAYMGSPQQ